MLNIILTAAITLIGGIILFIFQHIIIEIFIKPIQKQKEVIENIAISLIHFSNLYTSPVQYGSLPSDNPIRKKYMDAANKVRELAALLKVKSENILLYDKWNIIKYVLPKQNVEQAFEGLIHLANSFGSEGRGVENSDIADRIRTLLEIPKQS